MEKNTISTKFAVGETVFAYFSKPVKLEITEIHISEDGVKCKVIDRENNAFYMGTYFESSLFKTKKELIDNVSEILKAFEQD